MRWLDRVLQRWRFRVARPWVPAGGRVLDIGCHRGEFLDRLAGHIHSGVGFDPLAPPTDQGGVQLVAERFPIPAPFPDQSFDAVVLLATMEHIRDKERLPAEFARLLRPGGRVILTVPAPAVDAVVAVLRRLRLADGMSVEEHHGFAPHAVRPLFPETMFRLECWRRFQLGLNNLIVFRKRESGE